MENCYNVTKLITLLETGRRAPDVKSGKAAVLIRRAPEAHLQTL
jgi:hypothetical protein